MADPDSVRQYAMSARDAYFRMYHRYIVPMTTHVYFLFMYNIFVSFFSRIKSILLQFMLYIYIYICNVLLIIALALIIDYVEAIYG